MTAASTPVRDAGTGLGALFGLAGLALVGGAMGVGLVFGEVDALWASLSVIACIGVLYDFRVGAVLAILLLPMSDANLFPHAMFGLVGLNPLNLVLVATLGSYLLHGRLRQGGALVPQQVLWLYVVPIVVAGLLGSRNVDDIIPVFYEMQIIHFFEPIGYLRDLVAKPMITVAVALVLGAAVARSQKPERFLVPIGVSISLICLLSIWYVLRSGASLDELASPRAREFFAGIGLHANSIGRLFAVAYALLLFACYESADRRFRLACLAAMGLVVVSLLLTFSRGAFVGFLIVNALFLIWRFNARTIGLLLLAAVILPFVLPDQVFERMVYGFDEDANAVSAGRIDGIWLPLVPELFKSPIWGSGLGSVMWSDAMRNGMMLEVIHPHNAFLEAWLDFGLVGTGLLLAFYWHVWKNFRALGSNAFLTPELRGFYQGAAAGLLSFLITGFAGSSLVPLPETGFLWMAIGMMYGQLARRPAG